LSFISIPIISIMRIHFSTKICAAYASMILKYTESNTDLELVREGSQVSDESNCTLPHHLIHLAR
jgi:hypothetical protein